jgi:hypothetical protein
MLRRCRCRRSRLRVSGGGTVELLRNGCHYRGKGHLEVIAAATEIDEIRVVRVTQDPIEEPVAERFAVAAEHLERAPAQSRCRDGGIALDHRGCGSANQLERLFPPQ